MVVHEIYALIHEETVKNVIVGDYTTCNFIAHATFDDTAFAMEVTQYPVQEGDKYEESEFRRYAEDGTYTVIEYQPTDSQEISTLKSENAELTSTLDSILTEVIPSLTGDTSAETDSEASAETSTETA